MSTLLNNTTELKYPNIITSMYVTMAKHNSNACLCLYQSNIS